MKIVFPALVACYLLLLRFAPYKGSFIVKALPILWLALIVLLSDGSVTQLIFAALVFCAAGDIALDLDRTKYFLHGLTLFLVAHLFYIAAFLKLDGPQPRSIFALSLTLYAVAMSLVLKPKLGKLAPAVYTYIITITAMGITAARHNTEIATGAALFIISDSLIAIDKFVRPIPAATYWIMITYYLAQYLITEGILNQ
ncbi:MAG: lysoplasmalogenase [Acidobacteriota bacterium]|nr:lysoplasmalogenase [Blastocatellia bacterium]MDW8411214.1 lysoplasmalogenase [Acidobacteriota bacterium]